MRKILILVTCFGLFFSPAWGQTSPNHQHIQIQLNFKPGAVDKNQLQNMINLYQQGLAYFNGHDMHSAEKYLKQALVQAEPMKQALGSSLMAPLYAHTGYAVLFQGKDEEARSYLFKAQAYDPNAQPVQFLASQIGQIDDRPDYVRYHGKRIIRWTDKRKEIYIYINPHSPENMAILRQAFLTWQQAIDNQFEFVFVDTAEHSDVTVNWMDAERGEDGATQAGSFQPKGDDQYFYSAEISIALRSLQGTPLPKEHIYSAALHEIGHMFGLEHSPSPVDVMYPVVITMVKPTKRDIATFHALYRMKPDYTNPPTMTVAEYRKKMGY